jgi:hypothetical protein
MMLRVSGGNDFYTNQSRLFLAEVIGVDFLRLVCCTGGHANIEINHEFG